MNLDPYGPWPKRRRVRWIVAASAVFIFAGPPVFRSLKPPPDRVRDFYQEWSSARNVVIGLPVYMPIDQTLERDLGWTMEPGTTMYWDVNAHPPTSVLLALPLVGLDYRNAQLAWSLLSLAALGLSIWMLVRGLGIRFAAWSLLPTATLLLVFSPLQQQMIQGQLNLVLLLLIVGSWLADRKGKPVLSGVLLAAATAIKLFPGFLFLYFLGRRKWRSLVAGAAALILITAVTVGVVGVESVRVYVTQILPEASTWTATWNNASLAGFWYKLFDPVSRNAPVEPLLRSPVIAIAGTMLSWAVVVGFLLPVLWRARTKPESDRAFGLTVIAMLLISWITWEHYFLLALLPLAVVWVHLPRAAWAGRSLVAILVVLALPIIALSNALIPGGFFQGKASPAHTLTLLSLQCYALCGLFALGWLEQRRPAALSR